MCECVLVFVVLLVAHRAGCCGNIVLCFLDFYTLFVIIVVNTNAVVAFVDKFVLWLCLLLLLVLLV